MAVLEILKYPHPTLRKKSKAVKKIAPAISKLIASMIETMHAAPGVGLAAPQVGELLRIIVVDIGEGPVAIVNPRIVKRSGEQTFTEGCLSLPDLEGPVVRSEFVAVKGLNKNGKDLSIEAEGLFATVLQHEIDHLDGKLFIDRVEDPSLIRPITKEEEQKRDKVCTEGKPQECMM